MGESDLDPKNGHLASKHVTHGQRFSESVLIFLKKRFVGTLVRRLSHQGQGVRTSPQGPVEMVQCRTPVPMLPPPLGMQRRPLSPTTNPCPPLVATFAEVLSSSISTVRYIQAMRRQNVLQNWPDVRDPEILEEAEPSTKSRRHIICNKG